MRKRVHRSAIVLVTLLTCLLVATDRASAEDGITVIVPVNVTNLHEDVERVQVTVRFLQSGQMVGQGQGPWEGAPVVDRSVQEDLEVLVTSSGLKNILDADTYEILLRLMMDSSNISCWIEGVGSAGRAPEVYQSDHVCGGGRAKMQTYANLEGPLSDLIPE